MKIPSVYHLALSNFFSNKVGTFIFNHLLYIVIDNKCATKEKIIKMMY